MLNLSMPPTRTILQCGLAALASVMAVMWLRIRPLGIFFLLVFVFWFYKTQSNCRILAPPELVKKCKQSWVRLRELYKNNTAMYTAVVVGSLSTLALIGHIMSGSTIVLIGLMMAVIVFAKCNFQLVKVEQEDLAWTKSTHHDVHATESIEDYFMPEVNETNMFLLERASDLASSPTEDADEEDEEKSDEIPSELLIPDSIPEVDENSTDEDDEDLVPIINHPKNDISIVAASPSTSNTSAATGLIFKKRHFKRDSELSSSSSSDESLSKGLSFPDHMTVDGPAKRQLPASSTSQNQEAGDMVALMVKSQTQALIANSGKLLPNLVTSLVQWGRSGSSGFNSPPESAKLQRRIVTALDSSDDSDFEILDSDDCK